MYHWLLLFFRLLTPVVLYLFLGSIIRQLWRQSRRAIPAARLQRLDAPQDEWRLSAINSIGRHKNNRIVIDDNFVSAHHARLIWKDDAWWLADLNSTNGTLLQNQPVTAPIKMKPDDIIALGGIKLQLKQDNL